MPTSFQEKLYSMSSSDRPGQLTPMLRQYYDIKRRHPGTLLFFRLGDFYEMFFDDAVTGARELEITLTARHKEKGSPIPMCGVPYHAATGYIAKLVRKGYRVAVCEQVEDPASASKLVRREVVRIITPGTALESQILDNRQNNYLASVCGSGEAMGLALADISTGDLLAAQFRQSNALSMIREQLSLFSPSEIILPRSLLPLFSSNAFSAESLSDAGLRPLTREGDERLGSRGSEGIVRASLDTAAITDLDDWIFGFEHAESVLLQGLGVTTLDGFGLSGLPYAVEAAGAALHYIQETQRLPATHFASINIFTSHDSLVLDPTTTVNLELTSSLDGKPALSLLGVLDQTLTAMGARLLRQRLLRPVVDLAEINARLDAVEDLLKSSIRRDRLRKQLEAVADLERLAGRVSMQRANARDLSALGQSLDLIPTIAEQIGQSTAELLASLKADLDDLPDIRQLITASIADDPPAAANEAGMIREGFHSELDQLRALARNGKGYIASIETRERTRTGISSLKIKFNNNFGYFLEIGNAHRNRIPEDYERKQTLVNAERYTTPELKEYETRVLGAEQRILELETEIFRDIRNRIAVEVPRLLSVSRAVASIDVLSALAETAARRGFTKPAVHTGDALEIRAGRHPVIESSVERFVPNDVSMNNSTDRLLIITGPNMGGKSVYLKQTAIIVLLAHMGSFVPAESAQVPLTDRIFTRVGASDNLSRGRSTFMVEMIETANILNTSTPRSLILLDEVGRGTSTFDGLSLAWAIAEYIHDDAMHAAKTMFATHYHEMTELAKLRPGVRNYQVVVSESGGDIVFLRRVVPGAASKSYGIEVARLAGLPRSVIDRAREILGNLEQNELDPAGRPKFARHLKKPSKLLNQPSLLDLVDDGQSEEER
ncbi:MAG: DNA mismatch repair protein MutS [Acidobacteria bacterium]|nr:DNA mismatch repair protein MutS [Acidobacteriota bacterium]